MGGRKKKHTAAQSPSPSNVRKALDLDDPNTPEMDGSFDSQYSNGQASSSFAASLPHYSSRDNNRDGNIDNDDNDDDDDREASHREGLEASSSRLSNNLNNSVNIEDDSDTSELSDFSFSSCPTHAGTSPHLLSHMSVAKIQQRRRMRQPKFVRKGQERSRRKTGGEEGGANFQFRLGVPFPVIPRSYFHCNYAGGGFSLANEWSCFMGVVQHLLETIDEDRLPWAADFLDLRKMHVPRSGKEVLSRINLNIPYYAANYLEIFYLVTLPFLLLYNPPFFLVLLVSCVLVHSIAMRKKQQNQYDDTADIFGHKVTYHALGHMLLVCSLVLCLFFNGLKTVGLVLVIAFACVVPHALLRRVTFFDDEEMEKCRPKIGQYALTMLFLILCYLEGAQVKSGDDRGGDATRAAASTSETAAADGSVRGEETMEESARSATGTLTSSSQQQQEEKKQTKKKKKQQRRGSIVTVLDTSTAEAQEQNWNHHRAMLERVRLGIIKPPPELLQGDL